MPSSVDLPWMVLDLEHHPEQSPWVEQALTQRGLEGWEVHQETPNTKWRLYLPMEGNFHERLAELTDALEELGCSVAKSGQIRDEDWAENWKEFYHPFPVGERFVIAPSWEEPEESLVSNRKIIRLDPGSAFGTGYHESSRLCLQLLEDLTQDPEWGTGPVLDYGTGSGILAIGALLLGCPFVRASDRDPAANAVARINLTENGFSQEQFEVTQADVPQASKPYPFVVANLTADILTQLSIPLSEVCQKHIVMSGIVEKRAQKVRDAFERQGAKLVRKLQENDWVAYHFLFNRPS